MAQRWSRWPALLLLLASAGCLVIEPTDGVLVCNAPPEECPPGYVCGLDQHCWRSPPSSSGDDLGVDAQVPPESDGGSTPDLAVSRDLAGADLTGAPPPDLSGLDMVPPRDLLPPPDMTPAVFTYCPTGTEFCDNFENETIAIAQSGRWSSNYVMPPDGTQTLTTGTAQKRDGTTALHAASSMTVDSWALASHTLATATNSITVRLFVYPIALQNTAKVLRVQNASTQGGYQVGAASGGSSNWGVNQNLEANDKVSALAIAKNQWNCIELVVPATGNVQLFVNNATTPTLSFAPANTVSFDTVHVGVEFAPANVPVDVWIDQVAIAPSGRLPCP